MALRFLLDMGISPKVGEVLGSAGHRAVHVYEIGMSRADDADILVQARQTQAVVVTTDKDLANRVASERRDAPSVITLRLGNPSAAEQSAALQRLLKRLPEEAFANSLITLERHRYRRRLLPVS